MSRAEAEDLLAIDITFLRRHLYLHFSHSGTITWTRSGGWGESKSSVGIRSFVDPDGAYIRINYTQTENSTGEKKDFRYEVSLTTTDCNFGGKRHWFTCPGYSNGSFCGRRVGKLFKDGDYFACRHCCELSYRSQNESRRFVQFRNFFNAERKCEELEKKTKRQFYAGKPTRKYRRLQQLQLKTLGLGRLINEEDLY